MSLLKPFVQASGYAEYVTTSCLGPVMSGSAIQADDPGMNVTSASIIASEWSSGLNPLIDPVHTFACLIDRCWRGRYDSRMAGHRLAVKVLTG